MVDLGEVSQELVNGALEILTLDAEREKQALRKTTEVQDEKAEATESEDPQSKAEHDKWKIQSRFLRRQTRGVAKRITRSAAKRTEAC